MSDQIVYEFTCRGLESEQSLSVIDFKGFEAISRPYEFTINLKSESPDIDMDAMLSSPCTLRMRIGGYERPVHGVLSDFEQLHQVDRFTFYRAVLVPKLWQLSLYQANEIYLNDQADKPGTDVPEILRFILKEGGLNEDIDYRMALNGTYPKYPYRCQWNETHFNYISRLMEHEGIYYYFEQGDDRERIVFCDLRQAHVSVEDPAVNYSPVAGLDISEAINNIHALVCRQKRMPRTVILKDYNYEKPSLDVTGKAEVDPKGIGEVFRYGDNFETPEEGHRLAGIRAQEIFAGKERYFGESMVSRLVPGYYFDMRGHYRENFNREYLVTEIRHEGAAPSYLTDTGEAEPMSAYNNSLTAIPATVQFRPERRTEKPRFYGQINAVVDGETSGKYAELDDQGRYRIRLPFDRENSHGPGKASWWFRKAEPHAGPNEGMHFPLRQRTEVLLSFIDGDPDRPLIMNAIANTASPNVVVGKNQTKNVMQTSSGNLMEWEDQEGSERIKFSTPKSSTYMHLGAANAKGDGLVTLTTGIRRMEHLGGEQRTTMTTGAQTEEVTTYIDSSEDKEGFTEDATDHQDILTEQDAYSFVKRNYNLNYASISERVADEGINSNNDLTDEEETSGEYILYRQFGPRYYYGGGPEFNYGTGNIFNFGNSQEVTHWERDDDSEAQAMVETLYGFNPTGFQQYNATLPSADSWETVVSQGQVNLTYSDTFTAHTGNSYDFGGQWDYNLGNSYEENWMNQSGDDVELNGSSNTFFENDLMDAGGPYWTEIKWGDISDKLSKSDVEIGDDSSWTSDGEGSTNVWVTKTIGDSYDYTKGHSIEISQGDSLEVTHGGTHVEVGIRGGGSIASWEWSSAGVSKEKKWTSEGTLISDSWSESTSNALNSTETTYDRRTGTIASYEASSVTGAGKASFSTTFYATASADLNFGLAASFSLSLAGSVDIDVHMGLSFELKTGASLGLELDLRAGGVFELKTGPKLEFSGNGFTARKQAALDAKKAELEAEDRAIILDNILTQISNNSVQIEKHNFDIQQMALRAETGVIMLGM